ncbi:MAG: ATP-grasp domain-containing protein [bacterium]
MRKLLLLGAMQMHIPIIKSAKKRGVYVITCDYLPENEGHKYADETHFDSTTDFDAVLKLAKKCNVDGVMTFNSDPAALTAAYVAEQLYLPSSGYDAVKIMSEKDLFRNFLADNGFNTPKFRQYTCTEDLMNEVDSFNFPIVLKPVDSSGSKGITILYNKEDVNECFNNALLFSRCKRIIIEEYIDKIGPQMHGDAFVKDGKLKFVCLGDHHFNSEINNLVPISTTFPSQHSSEDLKRVEDEVARFISKVGFKQGGINIEARISASDNKVYLIEVGPRNGGNFTPIVIQYASGFNFMNACVCASLGEQDELQIVEDRGFFAYLVIHSDQDGVLKSIDIKEDLQSLVLERYMYVNIGDYVHSFKGANSALGVLLCKFPSSERMNFIANNMANFINVNLS